ncbi:MAG: Na+/Ca+ antiporter, CaCA family [Candidatus Uhrbacteria bacterium GW2011_GWA2_52_8d]|uniref:Na+/Ca+ antiporter, CaCA family n=1 Tax=Candidatus Uhrbacteria bacterium GW2011_GWA2_52_8d TaxID=1618979 RepID=A0A0G1XQ41_9BACT|nr:MAG: Na+/Ca+ antiporter, CaCA family [Candidatus Uhrbacteria bacterium GW2011_GWA2_52_8d]
MFLNILLVLGGFYVLIKGADYLVNGASSLARRLGVPALVIGLTVVAFGTSAPELFVNVIAALNGSTDIAIGNVLGSNLANILVILGITAIVAPLTLQSSTVWKEIPFSLLAAILVLVLGADMFFDGASQGLLGRIDGIVLLSFFVIFLVYTFGIREPGEKLDSKIEQVPLWKSTLYILGGLVALVLGGQFVVTGATAIALVLGISENLIGLTIVAVGTSLPELVSSIVAARKGHQDIAIGNVVGSNIFNIFFVLGATSMITPLPFNTPNMIDGFAVVIATFLMFFLLFVGRRHTFYRMEGALFILMYVGYLTFAIVRG